MTTTSGRLALTRPDGGLGKAEAGGLLPASRPDGAPRGIVRCRGWYGLGYADSGSGDSAMSQHGNHRGGLQEWGGAGDWEGEVSAHWR
jgi:hypothetical protein